jgi:hypothetical protein
MIWAKGGNMIELTEEQRRQMRSGGWPPRVVDPETREEFVLLHAALFDRARPLLEREDDIPAVEDMYAAVSEAIDRDESAPRESA